MFSAIWYHLYNLKNVENTHGGKGEGGGGVVGGATFISTKINTPPWVFFTFCKLYK